MPLLQRNGVGGNGAGGPGAQRAVGERSTGASAGTARAGVPNPELVERAHRRRFTSEYKLAILHEADSLVRPGEIGALLRRELYSSHLSTWRRQRDEGALGALSRPRGRKPAHPPGGGERQSTPAARAHRDRVREGPQGDRGSGKRLRASGPALGAPGREVRQEHRAMIEETVAKLTPLVGTRSAYHALGVSPATIYRLRRPPEPRAPRPRPTPGQGAFGGRARGRPCRASLRALLGLLPG